MFFKIGVLKSFANFTGKHQCWSLFLIKLKRESNKGILLKRDSNTGVFQGIYKILKNTFFTEHFRSSILDVSERSLHVHFKSSAHLDRWQTTAKSIYVTAQKMKFSIKDFFSKCDQIRSFLRIWSRLLEKSLMESFIFCAVCNIAIFHKNRCLFLQFVFHRNYYWSL